MDNRTIYEGFTIEARPLQLIEDSRWTTEITVIRDSGHAVDERQFDAANTWATREEAIVGCWEFGRQFIDGRIAGCKAP